MENTPTSRLHKQKFEKWGYRTSGGNRLMVVAHWFNGSRRRAKRSGIPFDLRMIDIEIPNTCPILGIPLVFQTDENSDGGTRRATDSSPSLDRIDNTKGYVTGNVRVISTAANRIKSALTIDVITALYKYINKL